MGVLSRRSLVSGSGISDIDLQSCGIGSPGWGYLAPPGGDSPAVRLPISRCSAPPILYGEQCLGTMSPRRSEAPSSQVLANPCTSLSTPCAEIRVIANLLASPSLHPRILRLPHTAPRRCPSLSTVSKGPFFFFQALAVPSSILQMPNPGVPCDAAGARRPSTFPNRHFVLCAALPWHRIPDSFLPPPLVESLVPVSFPPRIGLRRLSVVGIVWRNGHIPAHCIVSPHRDVLPRT